MNGDFVDCGFVSANLRSVGGRGSFVPCNFDGVNLRGTHLIGCRFVECSFRESIFGGGSLAKAVFEGIDLAQIDSKDTVLDGIDIRSAGPSKSGDDS